MDQPTQELHLGRLDSGCDPAGKRERRAVAVKARPLPLSPTSESVGSRAEQQRDPAAAAGRACGTPCCPAGSYPSSRSGERGKIPWPSVRGSSACLASHQRTPAAAKSSNAISLRSVPKIRSSSNQKRRSICSNFWSGASRARTDDLLHAMQALSQLSYSPSAYQGHLSGRAGASAGGGGPPDRAAVSWLGPARRL